MQNNEFDKLIETLSTWADARNPQNGLDLPAAGSQASTPLAPQPVPVNQAMTDLIRVASTSTATSKSVSVEAPAVAADAHQTTLSQEVDEITRLNAQLDQLRRAATAQSEVIADNTKALGDVSAASKTQTTSSGESLPGKIFSTVLGSGFGLTSLVSGIIGLFKGSSSAPVDPLPSYTLPAAVRNEVGITGSGAMAPVQYSQTGTPRPELQPASQVVVQIQAMDSRSVMDRSDDIARAVREAMLHSHSLNDVVTDL